jgi:hypothetical protein
LFAIPTSVGTPTSVATPTFAIHTFVAIPTAPLLSFHRTFSCHSAAKRQNLLLARSALHQQFLSTISTITHNQKRKRPAL